MAKILIGSPVFGEFNGSAAQVSVVLLELGFEAAEQREGVGGGSRKTGEDFFLVESADFLGFVLDYGLA
jgi:hypothetical protein